jgi:hypothetical protein
MVNLIVFKIQLHLKLKHSETLFGYVNLQSFKKTGGVKIGAYSRVTTLIISSIFS